MSMAAVGLAVAGGAASYLGAKEQAKGAKKALQYEQAMAQQDSMSAAWTQLLGQMELDKYGKVMQSGNKQILGHMGNAAGLSKMGMGLSQQANQQSLQQLAGAEQGAVQNILKQQNQALANNAQQGAGAGFGGSIQQGQANQIGAMGSEAVASTMGQFGQMKSQLVQQNYQNSMQALGMAIQGEQQMAGAYQQVLDNALTATQEKVSLLLATGNSFGLDANTVKAYKSVYDPMYGEMQKIQYLKKAGMQNSELAKMQGKEFWEASDDVLAKEYAKYQAKIGNIKSSNIASEYWADIGLEKLTGSIFGSSKSKKKKKATKAWNKKYSGWNSFTDSMLGAMSAFEAYGQMEDDWAW